MWERSLGEERGGSLEKAELRQGQMMWGESQKREDRGGGGWRVAGMSVLLNTPSVSETILRVRPSKRFKIILSISLRGTEEKFCLLYHLPGALGRNEKGLGAKQKSMVSEHTLCGAPHYSTFTHI